MYGTGVKIIVLIYLFAQIFGHMSSCDSCSDFYELKSRFVWEGVSDQYVVGSKSYRPDPLFKVTEIKQLCYFST